MLNFQYFITVFVSFNYYSLLIKIFCLKTSLIFHPILFSQFLSLDQLTPLSGPTYPDTGVSWSIRPRLVKRAYLSEFVIFCTNYDRISITNNSASKTNQNKHW